MHSYIGEREERGFTLIELLIAIVVVGILTAVAIVGIAGLTKKGSSAACNATADAVNSAQAVHFANYNTYPRNFNEMLRPPTGAATGFDTPELELSGATASADGSKISGNNSNWTLTVGVGADGTAKMPVSGC